MHSHSSFWPLPATPATPKISPLWMWKLTSSRPRLPSGFSTVRSTTLRMVCTSLGSGRRMARLTAWPTISSVRRFASTSAVATVSTLLPLRRMVTRSLMASTSFSLWVMMMTAQPLAFICRRMSKSLSVSWGVSTAVGSSRIKILAPR